MKRIVSVFLILTMILSFASVTLAAEPASQVLKSTNIVNVTGSLANGGNYVNILLMDGENVKYINDFSVESDGTYRAKFKYEGNIEGLTLQVKQGNADVTDSVISAITEEEALVCTFGATTLKTSTLAMAEFENYFNITGKTYVLMVAFYDADGKLISVKTTDKKVVEFDDGSSSDLMLDIPEGTDQIKTFLWDSTEKMIPLAKEKTTKPAKELSILTIGNSFTDDPTAYLDDIAAAEGAELKITKAHHGGSSIKNHWDYYKNNEPYYDSKTVDGQTVYTKKLVDYIDPELNGGVYYDIITFQQVSGSSGKVETYGFAEKDTENKYDNCAENLAKALRKYQPTAEIVLQLTWAYEIGYSPLLNYSLDGQNNLAAQTNMYNKIVETVTYACEKLADVKTDDGASISLDGKPLRYIPTGIAFQNAREFEIFQTERDESKMVANSSGTLFLDETKYISLHRDGYHSSHLHGRYLGALVWYGALTGNSPVATTYKHTYNGMTISTEAETILKNAAQDALDVYGRWN